MGIMSTTKKVVGQVVNFDVASWISFKYHKFNISYLKDFAKSLFTKQINTNEETFEQAVERLNLSEKDLAARKKEFLTMFILSLIISLGIFMYTMIITIKYKNIYSFLLGLGVTILSLTKTFRYHFWLTQIIRRKLGMSLKDWLE